MGFPIVPVVMLHMVNDQKDKHPWPWLITPVEIFEDYLRFLKDQKYTTITFTELYSYLNYGKGIPSKSIVLTFDDGYLDTWVNVYPLLVKYDMKGIVLVSSDFIDRSSGIRPNLEDLWSSKVTNKEINDIGYLREDEIVEMDKSGVFEIGAHCKTHSRVFCTDRVISFHKKGNKDNPWLAWNLHPECRLFWQDMDFSELIPEGTIIYEKGMATSERKYIPDPKLQEHIYQFINIRGKDTLNKRNWKSILLKQISNWRSENIDCGRYETEAEQYDRLIEEIVSPKIYLEDLLNHPVNYLCWPGGGSSELSWQIAREAGYLATTVRSHPNQFGKRIDMIDRLSIRLVNIPVIGREINKILFKYAISKYTQKFPYYQLWVIKRILRNQSIQKPVKFGPSKEY